MYQRYGDPISLLDTVIAGKKIDDFVIKMFKKDADEIQEKNLWEVWLHKNFDGNPSWIDFREQHLPKGHKSVIKEQVNYEKIVMQSQDILENFNKVM